MGRAQEHMEMRRVTTEIFFADDLYGTQCCKLGCGYWLEGTEGIEKGNEPPAERGPAQDVECGER